MTMKKILSAAVLMTLISGVSFAETITVNADVDAVTSITLDDLSADITPIIGSTTGAFENVSDQITTANIFSNDQLGFDVTVTSATDFDLVNAAGETDASGFTNVIHVSSVELEDVALVEVNDGQPVGADVAQINAPEVPVKINFATTENTLALVSGEYTNTYTITVAGSAS